MRVIAFAPKHNRIKSDATGAFQPELKAFCEFHEKNGDNVSSYLVDNHKSVSIQQDYILSALRDIKACDVLQVAFFNHGWPTGMDYGFHSGDSIHRLTCAIMRSAPHNVIVTLYACLTGDSICDGAGSFADRVRDDLFYKYDKVLDSIVVDSHTKKGHATMNPFVRRFSSYGRMPITEGGVFLVDPSHLFWPKWRSRLKQEHDTLRFRFSRMTQEEIIAELKGAQK